MKFVRILGRQPEGRTQEEGMASLRSSSLFFSLLASSAVVAAPPSAVVVQPLSSGAGVSWRLSNANGSVSVPGSVPGAAHLDLLRAGLVGEPYAALNVDAQAWVASEAWTYTATFTADAALLAAPAAELVADGIETVASVALNGVPLWASTSAFRRMSADVTRVLRAGAGANTLVVAIASPLAAAAANFATCTGWCPPLSSSPNETAAVGFNYLRAPPVSWGWDFAPHFVGSGIWRPIFLRGFGGAALDEVTVVTTPAALPVPRGAGVPSAWTADFVAWATGAAPAGAAVTVEVAIDELALRATARGAVVAGPGGGAVAVSLAVPAALAWWPAGLGAPRLYNATVTLTADGVGGSVSARTLEIGFRHTQLEQPSAPNGGAGSLYIFAVNGARLYVKGANWVPTDAFPARIAEPVSFAPKLAAFVDAGFNTLRVWGGGHPQAPPFYTAAARAGLLLWHEMPFACQNYPGSGVPGLLETVRAETSDIVRRLQSAPILAWGGNNEIGQINHYAPGCKFHSRSRPTGRSPTHPIHKTFTPPAQRPARSTTLPSSSAPCVRACWPSTLRGPSSSRRPARRRRRPRRRSLTRRSSPRWATCTSTSTAATAGIRLTTQVRVP